MRLHFSVWLRGRTFAVTAATILILPILAGCGSGSSGGSNMAPVDDTVAGGSTPRQMAPPKKGKISTTTKVVLLAGAAALYYMYKKNQAKRAQGDTSQPQYYLSKNGRVYYRDSTGRAHWVTPPQGGISVPASEARQYSGYQGYNNSSSGKTLENSASAAGAF
jgi:hypothetical protein